MPQINEVNIMKVLLIHAIQLHVHLGALNRVLNRIKAMAFALKSTILLHDNRQHPRPCAEISVGFFLFDTNLAQIVGEKV